MEKQIKQNNGSNAPDKRIFKTLQFKMDAYNEEEGIFSGYASIFSNVDSGGDIVEPGAFTKTLAEGWERVKILALHNDSWLPIGRPIELREDAGGLYISAKISDTSMGRDVKVLLKDRVLNELSIGYDPVVYDYDDAGIRHLREVKLWEVSIVIWAMNPEATINGYKSVQETAERAMELQKELQEELKEGRKISPARIKALEDASRQMKQASRLIDTVVKEARGEKNRQKVTNKKSDNMQIEICI